MKIVEKETVKISRTSLSFVQKCPDQRKVFPTTPCVSMDCPWHVDGPNYMNCSFVVGRVVHQTNDQFTLEEVGGMLGITRERVRQIEERAVRKLRIITSDDVRQSSLASGENRDGAGPERPEHHDQADVVHPVPRGKLGQR